MSETMKNLSIGQKNHRIVAFLEGAVQVGPNLALQKVGLGPSDLDEGWQLIHQSSDHFLAKSASPARNELDKLDQWENRNFPIVRATLTRHFPAVADQVFKNLPQTSGPELIGTVGVFLDRIDVARRGPEGDAIMAKLAQRSVTPEVFEACRELTRRLMTLVVEDPRPAERQAARQAAEGEAWKWYLEWSTIARATIKDRKVLRQLGFLKVQKCGEPNNELVPSNDGVDDVPVVP